MIISFDTNILVQVSLTNGLPKKVLMYVSDNHKLVLSSVVIHEYKDVINRNYILDNYCPIDIIDILKYEVIETPKQINSDLFN